MFTGIVTEQGLVKRARDKGGVLGLEIEAPKTTKNLGIGHSVASTGLSHTDVDLGRKRFSVQASPETLALTTLSALDKGATVNLELAARLSDRLGGHLVQGHVDGTATAVRVEEDEGSKRMWFSLDPGLLRYLAPKGSVTLDGVALTLVDVGRTSFQVAVIPHTLEVTSLGSVRTGTRVNVEVDLIARYVERLTHGKQEA